MKGLFLWERAFLIRNDKTSLVSPKYPTFQNTHYFVQSDQDLSHSGNAHFDGSYSEYSW